MPDAKQLAPPVPYRPLWLIIGVTLLVAVVIWYGVVWYLTRRRKLHTIHTLPLLHPAVVDLAKLKAKYLALISDIERQYQAGKINARTVHQVLSMTVRLFVFEARGLRAHLLTLSDLKKSDQTALVALIEAYYPPEFAELENGSAPDAIAGAKGLVSAWS
jgi:carbon starvation protein CstA